MKGDKSYYLSLQFYSSGVYDQPTCSSSKLSHAIVIVGYGTDDRGKDYWLVKNRSEIF